MRFKADLKSSAGLAVFVHLLVVFLFAFRFSDSIHSFKPDLVFLGSFLRLQDLELSSALPSEGRANLDVRTIDLDSHRNRWPFAVSKPSLTQKAIDQTKNQFKPVAAQPLPPTKSKKTDDLGIDFEPLPPVKLKLNR